MNRIRHGMIRLTLLFPLGILTGCLHIHAPTELAGFSGEGGGEILQTVEVENNGWFLLDCIPLVTGTRDGTAWFRNRMTLQTNIDVLDGLVQSSGAKRLGPLTTHETDESVFLFILNRRTLRTSATLMK